MHTAVVGLDVFHDPVFASSLRPSALQLFYVPCSSPAITKKFSVKLASRGRSYHECRKVGYG